MSIDGERGEEDKGKSSSDMFFSTKYSTRPLSLANEAVTGSREKERERGINRIIVMS